MIPRLGSCTQNKMIGLITFIFLFIGVGSELVVNEEEVTVLVGGQSTFSLNLTEPLDEEVTVKVSMQEKNVLQVNPENFTIPPNTKGPFIINVTGISGGHILVVATLTPNITSDDNAFIRITVEYSDILDIVSLTIGWIYFFAWSISFYPQIYDNFKRKSVIGLNFDFLALNIVGFALYGTFNCGLYWIPEIREEYFAKHPRGLNPVQLNDIVFAVHATFATLLTIGQCFCYERGEQRVSTTARSILGLFFLIIITILGLALFHYIQWLDFLYYCSYIKLFITLIKYIPQAFMNFQRKSTVGWSIGNVFLDFTGGMLSMGQMLINAYNYNDWVSIFGDPTKFGLGLFSVFFDVFFIIQHYILYRFPYEPIPGNTNIQVPADTEENLDETDDPPMPAIVTT